MGTSPGAADQHDWARSLSVHDGWITIVDNSVDFDTDHLVVDESVSDPAGSFRVYTDPSMSPAADGQPADLAFRIALVPDGTHMPAQLHAAFRIGRLAPLTLFGSFMEQWDWHGPLPGSRPWWDGEVRPTSWAPPPEGWQSPERLTGRWEV